MARMRWSKEEYDDLAAHILNERAKRNGILWSIANEIKDCQGFVLPPHRRKLRISKETENLMLEALARAAQANGLRAVEPIRKVEGQVISALDLARELIGEFRRNFPRLIAKWEEMEQDLAKQGAPTTAAAPITPIEPAWTPSVDKAIEETQAWLDERRAVISQQGAAPPKLRIAFVGYHDKEVREIEAHSDRSKWPARLTFKHPQHDTRSSKLVDSIRNCDMIVCRTKFLSHAHAAAVKDACGGRVRWLTNHGVEAAIQQAQTFLDLNKSKA